MIHSWVAFSETICQTKLNGIHLHLLTQFVNCCLQREGSLRSARSTICAYPHLISHHLKATEVVIGTAIAAAKGQASQENCGPSIRTGIKNDCTLHCYKRAIMFRANLKGYD